MRDPERDLTRALRHWRNGLLCFDALSVVLLAVACLLLLRLLAELAWLLGW